MCSEMSWDRQGSSEESIASSLQEAEWRDTSIPGSDHLHALPCTLPRLSSECADNLHWMLSRASSLASQPCCGRICSQLLGVEAPDLFLSCRVR